MDPPAEGAGVIQVGLQDAGVFGQDILPVGDPMIGPTGGGEDALDGFGTPRFGRVGEVGANFGGSRNDAGGVEREPAEKLKVGGEGGGPHGFGFELGADEAVDGVVDGQCSRKNGNCGAWGLREVRADFVVAGLPFGGYGDTGQAAAHYVGGIVALVDGGDVTLPGGVGEEGRGGRA